MGVSYDRKIIHEFISPMQYIIRLVYTSLISCACVFPSWLVQGALVSLAVRGHTSINLPFRERAVSLSKGDRKCQCKDIDYQIITGSL